MAYAASNDPSANGSAVIDPQQGAMSLGTKRSIASARSKRNDPRFRILIFQDTREPPFATADIEHTTVLKVTKVAQNQLDVKDARIDCGWKMLLIRRSLIEAAPDFVQGDGG